jgi:hypothetical protein
LSLLSRSGPEPSSHFNASAITGFTCVPQEEPDPDAEYIADDLTCLGLGCHDRDVVLTGLGHWISGHPKTARLTVGPRELAAAFEPDNRTLEPFGRLAMRSGPSREILDAMLRIKTVSARTDESGPFAFSMDNYAQALQQVRRACR